MENKILILVSVSETNPNVFLSAVGRLYQIKNLINVVGDSFDTTADKVVCNLSTSVGDTTDTYKSILEYSWDIVIVDNKIETEIYDYVKSKFKTIEVDISKIHNIDDKVRESEIDKIVGGKKIHWLVKMNVIKDTNPNKETQQPRQTPIPDSNKSLI